MEANFGLKKYSLVRRDKYFLQSNTPAVHIHRSTDLTIFDFIVVLQKTNESHGRK